MTFAAITPHAYRPFDIKVLGKNIGDGFILKAVERFLGPIAPDMCVPARRPPTAASLQKLKTVSYVVMAGANQLHDHFSPWPGLSADDMRRKTFRFVPMGVGISGKHGGGLDLIPEAKERLLAMHERISFSSWRCPRTVEALVQVLPELRDQLLMTCCPVLLDKPLLDGQDFRKEQGTIAATITDRDDFWDRESTMLKRIADVFPKSRKLLILHQDFSILPASLKKTSLSDIVNGPPRKIRAFAKSIGFEIKVLRSAEEGVALYRDVVDLHFGSRLHAHLLMMSLAKWSYLTYVDERMSGISEFLGFPLCQPGSIDKHLDFDFEIVRRQARKAHLTMQKFVTSLGD
jgi:Polysaccharide pyruvyl transferase